MEPEQSTGNKKLFIFSVALVLVILASLLFLLTKKGDTPASQEEQNTSIATAPPRVYTEAEKMDILKNIAAQTSKDATSQSQDLKTLNNLSKQTPKETTTTEDKLKILQALSTQTN